MKPSRIAFLVFGGLVTVNALAATVASSFHTGVFLNWCLGLLLLSRGIWHRFWTETIPKALRFLCYGGGAILLLFVCFLIVYGQIDTVTYDEDAVIVLGAGVRGEQLSRSLQNRLDAVVDYAEKNPGAVVIVSGGQGKGEDISEALAMERYLLSRGVSAERIRKEELSTSTRENFRFSQTVLSEMKEPYCIVRIAFATSDYHVFRAAFLARDAGFEQVTHLHGGTPWFLHLPNGLREAVAVVVQCVFS